MHTIRHKAWLLAVALVLGAIALAPPASADLNHYIRITGATQGVFPGGTDVAPWEGYSVGFEYHHLMERPTSGSPTQHQTVISTMRMDEPLVPHLMRAMDTDESLTVVFNFFRPGTTGAEQQYSKITLTGARIVSLEPLSTDDQDPALAAFKATVRVRYSYATINFEHSLTGGSAVLTNSGN